MDTMEEATENNKKGSGLVKVDSLEAEIEPEKPTDGNGFSEDYSISETTTLDVDLKNYRSLCKQQSLDEFSAMDLQWKLEKEEKEAKHKKEIDENTLERLEVAALIKKAEEKLLPDENIEENMVEKSEEIPTHYEEIIPELVKVEKAITAADLIRMESSDLSSEEGFRLRLSCILEESESDASGSGIITKKKLGVLESSKNAEIGNAKLGQGQADGDVLERVQEIANTAVLDETLQSDSKSEEPQILDTVQNENVVRPTDQGDSVESNSPEPTFGIRRLQSGTHVDKLQTKPNLVKRLESSSDSSLDISIATASPGTDDKSIDNYPKIAFSQPPTEEKVVETLNVISDSINKSKSTTPDNVKVEFESAEEPIKETNNYEIEELTEEQVEAMFPKVGKLRTSRKEDVDAEDEVEPEKKGKFRRGQSLEYDRKSEDSKSVSSCHVLSSQPRRLQAIFAKLRKSGRGKSLDSGMTEKEAEKKRIEEKRSKTEVSSQKGLEEKPEVPPETYLWEELRRWRIKGGYPWTHLDKPPFDEKTWKNKMDHEYEPVNPPPLNTIAKPTENDENQRGFLRIPRDDELIVSSASAEDMEVEAIGAARDLQDDLDDRFLATPLTTTTASRTDCDVNTSMLDSSGLEDLPLQRGSRSKKAIQTKTEQMRAQAQGIQQRIRSQAGKLRNKLRSIPRPSFQRKQERASKAEGEEKPRFKFPERPKFSLPEKAKFKMPQKPKISLPNFTKPLRERQAQAKATDEPKKNLFDIDFKTYPRMFNKKSRDRGDYATSSPKMPRSATPPPGPVQPSRKKGPVGQRWVNRFEDIKFADDRASEISHASNRSEISESLSGFHDRDFAITEDLEHSHLPPPRALSTKSSISRLSDREVQSSRSSEDLRRKGVIEEIDSDQFFLRQKGISEDDINLGNYLSKEIKEAFRAPVVSALRQMDLDYEENEKPTEPEPLAPTRMRSLKRTPKVSSKEEPVEETQKYRYDNIEVDIKPSRYENIDGENAAFSAKALSEDPGYNVSEHYKTPPPPQEYHHYKVPRSTKRKTSAGDQLPNKKKENGWVEVEIETELEEVLPEEPPQPLQRRKSKRSLKASQSVETPAPEHDYIIPGEEEPPPEPPIRTRSLSRGARSIHSLAKEMEPKTPIPPKRTSSKSINSLGLTNDSLKKEVDTRSIRSTAFENGKSATLPIKRTRSKSTRSFHSLAQDDQTPQAPERIRSLSRASHTSRSYHSVNEDAPQAPERTRSLSRAKSRSSLPPESIVKTVNQKNDDPYYGYAVVEKVKPPRPPPPRRQKGSHSPVFNTFPRHSPIRPVRNYATLGPSRPPRKTRLKPAKSEEHIYTSDQMSQSYTEVDTANQNVIEDLHLQATDVVEKMKVRPLPAPPRPPRLKAKSEEQGQSMEEVEEVCVSTQTDPLPDDICLEDDIIQEFSHEQLKLQEEFLKEMREEEERIQREIEAKRARHIDVTAEREQNEAKLEIIRQIDDIIQEERRLLERERHEDEGDVPNEKKTAQLEVHEDDMGYASLDRRQTWNEEEQEEAAAAPPVRPVRTQAQPTKVSAPTPEAQPSTSQASKLEIVPSTTEPSSTIEEPVQQQQQVTPLIPSQLETVPSTTTTMSVQPISQPDPVYIPLIPEIVSTERLRVGHLEVDRLTVNELAATHLMIDELTTRDFHTTDMRGNTLQIQNITSQTGNLALERVELPPEFIQQIIARIPWEELRPRLPDPEPVVRKCTDNEPVATTQQLVTVRRRHRTLKQRSRSKSSDDEPAARQISPRRHHRTLASDQRLEPPTVGELSLQLARTCTNAGLQVVRDLRDRIKPVQEERQGRIAQAILCVLMVAIAGYLLLSLGGKDVHHHHWDFQFPPQPPKP